MNELHPLIASSADPTKIALTVRGLALALVPVAVQVLRHYGIEATEESLTGFLMRFTEAVTAFIAAAMLIVGLVRKAYYALQRSTA